MVAGPDVGASAAGAGRDSIAPHPARARWLYYLLAAGAIGLAMDLRGLHEQRRINTALAAGDIAPLAVQDTPRGRLARAYALHAGGQVEEAITAYAAVSPSADAQTWAMQRFNLANLYLERAVDLERGGEEDEALAISLIELAKENYREILARDEQHWDARYNLSRALEMLPDVGAVDFDDEIMPERSPRAPQAARSFEGLP